MPRRRVGPGGTIVASGIAGAATAAAGLASADYIPQPVQIVLIPVSGLLTAAATALASFVQGTSVPHQKKTLFATSHGY